MITLTKEEIDTLLDRLRMGRVACEWAGESASAEVPKFQAAMDMLNEKLFRLAQGKQPVQEPVLVVEKEPDYWSGGHFHEGTKSHIDPTKVWALPIGTKLYTAPQPRQWQGLTEEDLFDIAIVNFGEPDLQLFIEMGKLVQKELKEKNA